MRDLHTLLLETEVMEGKMVCGNCGHEYKIKEGIANFLLPNHLGESNFDSCVSDWWKLKHVSWQSKKHVPGPREESGKQGLVLRHQLELLRFARRYDNDF